jgi:hypothetical protein
MSLWQKLMQWCEAVWTFRIDSHWQIQGTLAEVMPICRNAAAYPGWWRPAFLDVVVLTPGDEHGMGLTADLYTQGWLPYRLRLRARVAESRPHGFTVVTGGDLAGEAVWTLAPAENGVRLHCQWTVTVRRPLLRFLAFLFKPILASNHRWSMALGQLCLQDEVIRRR